MSGTQGTDSNATPSWSVDEADLDALKDAISRVLEGEADRLRLHDHIDGKIRLGRSLWSKAVELGWIGIGLPTECGGLGFGPQGLNILHREIGARVAPGPFMASLSAAQALAEVADFETRSIWLPRLAAGECSLAVAALPLSANVRDNIWLLGADDAEAALVPTSEDTWGLVSLAEAVPVQVWDRTRTVFSIDLAKTKPVAVLPGEATGSSLARHLALAAASDSIGGARAITQQTVAYMKEREQFGRPIASFQALKHRIADLMTMIVSGDEIVSLAVEAVAAGDPDANIWVNLAKARATDTYVHASTECLQLHGGVGFTWEFDVHMYLKRARLNEMLVASNLDMRDRAAAGFADALRAGKQPLELAL